METFERLGLEDKWAFYDGVTGCWFGPRHSDAVQICRTADVLINVSGLNRLRDWLLGIPVRVFVDTDPAFTQIRNLTRPEANVRAHQHAVFFSFGENIGSGECSVPDDGIGWIPTRQPTVLDLWPVVPGVSHGPYTTVMLWDSYDPLEYDGRRYGLKSDSFSPFLSLPSRTQETLELAIGSPTAPGKLLKENGWRVVNPLAPTRDPWTYQAYIRQSKGEFSVAKEAYAVTRSGWFSERSAAYLASGRPVVTQETGFSAHLPTGRGLIAFETPDQALDALREIDRNYDAHCTSARDLAAEYFNSDLVLSRLLDRAFDGQTPEETGKSPKQLLDEI